MDADADTDRAFDTDDLATRGDRVDGSTERHEERVALRVDLDAVVRGEDRAQRPPMLGEQVGVAGAVLVEQARRTFDVGEQEGDGAGREVAHRPIMRAWQVGACETIAPILAAPRTRPPAGATTCP